jgi:hypothetical protein
MLFGLIFLIFARRQERIFIIMQMFLTEREDRFTVLKSPESANADSKCTDYQSVAG